MLFRSRAASVVGDTDDRSDVTAQSREGAKKSRLTVTAADCHDANRLPDVASRRGRKIAQADAAHSVRLSDREGCEEKRRVCATHIISEAASRAPGRSGICAEQKDPSTGSSYTQYSCYSYDCSCTGHSSRSVFFAGTRTSRGD